ncbi:MAG: exosortase/archaeosortase family protein [Syntrophobacteraceae bacterium]|jgi:exosortase
MQEDKGMTPADAISVVSRIKDHANGRARRFAYYFASLFLGICAFALPLKKLIGMSLYSELYSYIPLIFATSCYFLASGRKKIFDDPAWSFGYGAPVLILSLAAGVAGLKNAALLGPNDYLCAMTFSFWLFLTGTFILCFGTRSFVKAIFPLALLLFTIPFPDLLHDKIVTFLQAASFNSASLIFNTLGFFPLERGFFFQFPEMTVEVARQCSGIRSSTALVILSLLSGHFFLRSSLNRVLLVIFAVLIAIFKNGVRIVGLTLGGIYVDSRIMSGPVHRTGGVPVFILAFALLSIVVLVMSRLEKRTKKK